MIRILRYFLLDSIMMFVLAAVFLFNQETDGRANILMTAMILYCGMAAAVVLLIYYVLSAAFNFYNVLFHFLLFLIFMIVVNSIALSDIKWLTLGFYWIVFFASAAIFYGYIKWVLRINRDTQHP